jgi:hypothetical protein
MSNPFELPRTETDQIKDQTDKFDAAGIERRIRDAQPVSDNVSGITNVPLDRINATDIQAAGDFKSTEQYTALRREATMLGQMQPALERGANADTFDTWDKSNKIGHYSPDQYVRGYTDVYRSYYGDEAVTLDPKSDGTFDVINGRHRIAAAREAGLRTIPAKVLG